MSFRLRPLCSGQLGFYFALLGTASEPLIRRDQLSPLEALPVRIGLKCELEIENCMTCIRSRFFRRLSSFALSPAFRPPSPIRTDQESKKDKNSPGSRDRDRSHDRGFRCAEHSVSH